MRVVKDILLQLTWRVSNPFNLNLASLRHLCVEMCAVVLHSNLLRLRVTSKRNRLIYAIISKEAKGLAKYNFLRYKEANRKLNISSTKENRNRYHNMWPMKVVCLKLHCEVER
ncbi:CLUMA_CG018340, isoform A [Clunio marinus]|uniref:CLUMA_CG018340, isoform A n=1 Tax=Clunio marinus TaxID=568069 RepID=A0A1J1IZG5_9DIPT|nr:CLUMA_CG018340, isoform A [Clunio marinus]